MSKIMSLLFIILFLVACESIALEEKSMRILVTAKPVAAKFLQSNTENGVIKPPSWEVTLEDFKVIEGKSKEYTYTNKLKMRAHHKDALLNYDSIYLLLELRENNPEVIYWERVVSMVCLPQELVNTDHSEDYFDDKFGRENVRCKFLRR